MDSILDQLVNDQAMLLMYLANELPSQDRTTIEERLARDVAFRAQLEELSMAHDLVTRSLAEMDMAQRLPGTPTSHERIVSRVIGQWQADRLRQKAASTVPQPAAKMGLGWLLPAAVAASVLIGFVAWWDAQLERQGIGGNYAMTDGSLDAVSSPQEQFAADRSSEINPAGGVDSDEVIEGTSLKKAENDLLAVSLLRSFSTE